MIALLFTFRTLYIRVDKKTISGRQEMVIFHQKIKFGAWVEFGAPVFGFWGIF